MCTFTSTLLFSSDNISHSLPILIFIPLHPLSTVMVISPSQCLSLLTDSLLPSLSVVSTPCPHHELWALVGTLPVRVRWTAYGRAATHCTAHAARTHTHASVAAVLTAEKHGGRRWGFWLFGFLAFFRFYFKMCLQKMYIGNNRG